MKKAILIIGFLILCLGNAQSQNSSDEILDAFFTLYGEGKTDDAVDYIFETNQYLLAAQQQISSMKEKLKTITSVIGQYYGYEKIIQKEAGASYKYVRCMVKHDRQPLFFTFIFYKPDQKWQLQTVKFDDKLEDEELKELKNAVQ
jgi:hypothetical protein